MTATTWSILTSSPSAAWVLRTAGFGRIDFGRNLVGFKGKEDVAGIYGLAVLLVPDREDA